MSYSSFGGSDAGPPPSPHSRPGRLARHRRAVVASVAVVLIVIAGATIYLAGATADRGRPLAGASPAAPANPPSPSSSSSSSSVATPPATAAPKVPTTGWVAVDHAAWKAQVDAYQALKVDPVPAGVGNLAEFRADCQYSHSRPDDPIVFPGVPGASHMHSFIGNEAVDANTVAGDLQKFTATTCKPVQDHSSYWVPTLYDASNGKAVEPTGFRVYYRSLMTTSTQQLPMPNGLRMISGDATRKEPTPRGAHGQFYCAFYGPGDLDGVARSTDGNWPICGGNATLHFMLQFPDCWDGEHLDSPNHKDHVAYGAGNACPAGHPVKIPALTFDIQYGARGTTAGYYLSSDTSGRSASSMHGDAFLMWDADTMNKRTKDCILQRRTCDDYGYQT